MEHNNFIFNPRRYEDRLSPLGKKVLNALIHREQHDQNRAKIGLNNAYHLQQRYFTPSPHRRVLTFRNEENIRPAALSICNEINSDNEFNGRNLFDCNLVAQTLPRVRTNLQPNNLVQTFETTTSSNTTADDHISSHDLINPILNDGRSTDLGFFTRNYVDDVTDPNLLANNSKTDKNNSNNIDWDDMFDSDLFSEVPRRHVELVCKEIESPIPKGCSIQHPRQMSNKISESSCKANSKKTPTITKPKRKQQPITNDIPEKVKKVSSKTKPTFRKEKYTKTVSNWLDDVNSNNLVERDEMSNISVEQTNVTKQAEIIIEKGREKSNKKVIQAQLANKNGVMKFGKPKTNDSNKQKNDNLEKFDEIIDDNCVNKTNTPKKSKIEKDSNKDKPKFVVPIKSQLPVRDVTFKVITFDANSTKDHMETLRSIENQELAIVLTYSNSFCQLNIHHTEDTCYPEGIFIGINDDFYYFKGLHPNNKYILQTLLEKNKIICFEAKALFIFLKSKLNLDLYNIDTIDTKIGGSLLDPDSPTENFFQLQKLLSFVPDFTIATECTLQKTAWYSSLLKECGSKLMSLLIEEQLWNVFVEIEMKLLPIIAEMERRGVIVDLQKLKTMENILLAKLKYTELECHKAAGKRFQINSTVQVRALIYDELQLDTKCNVKITETLTIGAKSTSESMLRNLVSKHPLPKLILEYRHLHKAHATFLSGIAQHSRDGIVRPTWVQTAAATGRIASNNPNLQAIPKAPFNLVMFPDDNNTGQQVLCFRSVYVAREGYTLLAADFKHVECRVFAHAAADTGLLAVLRDNQDLFRVLAHKWLKKPESEVSAEDRERTKRIVYASLYGAGRRKLMDILDVSYEQALSVIASFNRTFPSLKDFSRSVVCRCEQNGGRLSTLSGRARRFKNISSSDFTLKSQAERQAVNFIIQGSAADLCKKAMVLTSEQLRSHSPAVDGSLLLQIHDELVWEVKDQHLNTAAVIIKRVMESCGVECGMELALPVALAVGSNWGEMTEYLPSKG